MTVARPALYPSSQLMFPPTVPTRYHLVLDADHFLFEAGEEELRWAWALLQRHRGLELTLLTRHQAWGACRRLCESPFPLACHLVAANGEALLHLPGGGEWSPDADYATWSQRLTRPMALGGPTKLHLVPLAIQYLECFWKAPRPLLVGLGDPSLAPAAGLADTAFVPATWQPQDELPQDTVRLEDPTLMTLLLELTRRFTAKESLQRALQIGAQ